MNVVSMALRETRGFFNTNEKKEKPASHLPQIFKNKQNDTKESLLSKVLLKQNESKKE